MSFKVIPKSALPAWIEFLASAHTVYAPQTRQGKTRFTEIHSAAEVNLDYATTILPPKKMLLPQREELIRFKGNGKETEPAVQPVFDTRPTVILGIHTCDMHAVSLLDEVMRAPMVDPHYRERRANTTLVSLDCLKPCSPEAFCQDMGTHFVPEEFDLHLTDLGEAYAAGIGSEKGAALLDGFAPARAALPEDFDRLNQVMSQRLSRFPYRLNADAQDLPKLLSVTQSSPVWAEIGAKCLGCGTCNLTCPTCFCFDVFDTVDFSLQSGTRARVWDSCQLERFALVAGGHDFRNKRAKRLRHRFAHKYEYLSQYDGLEGCVGCGRCATQCLVKITPIGVLNQLSTEKHYIGETNSKTEVRA
ncbi:MAG: 4Fe-4S dicluster domain-containing protein [Chloroflexi bacterium]|jgi:sulfhydrogenase subunit beta (sulfur reductase)|nr:4Fe-4S dicluster domain-containing protein [Chloroflexota bacterium]